MIALRRLLLFAFLLALGTANAATPPEQLTVTLRGSTATVLVPAGVVQVTLERAQDETWQPLAVRHFKRSTSSRAVRFTVPADVPADQLRATGYRRLKFPTRISTSAHHFERPGTAQTDEINTLSPEPLADNPDGGKTETPVVEESDIWKIVGTQLFFFNQYRGLQVFDLTDPTHPRRTGTLRMAASGEQFYVLNTSGTQLALLGRSNAAERAGAATLFLLNITNGVPSLIAEVPLTGEVSDSRLIGKRLYIMSTNYVETNGNWQPETQLHTIDLTRPETPVSRKSLRFDGSATALQAAGGYLLLTTDQYDGETWWATSRLHLCALSATDGTPTLRNTFDLKGQVQDKFKISVVGTAAVATSLYWHDGQRETWIETFPLTGASTAPLAQLELEAARGEQLHATRYDGNRLYVVTFFNTDPLFVVDLTNPAAPVLTGALEIPGWSTYIEPLGDRLLTVGVEDGRVAVSLFNVADVTAPTLLSRLALGEAGSWSWSEANYDEKAVGYFPDAGIVLVPFQSSTADGYVKAVQAIQVGADKLTADALIVHDFEPRRGAVLGNYFVSISGQELLVLDRTTATTGELAAQVTLAWTTERVIPVGNYLVQLEDGSCNSGGWYWYGCASTTAVARITTTTDPDDLVATVNLGAGRIVGMTSRGQRLYLVQFVSANDEMKTAQLRASVLDLTALPALPLLTTLTAEAADVTEWNLNFAAAQLLWTDDQNLVWQVPAQHNYWWGPVLYERKIAPPADADTALAALVWPLRDVTTELTAGDVLRVTTTESLRGASPARAQNGLLFFSVDTAVGTDDTDTRTRPLTGDGWWYDTETRHSWLQVIDLRSATPVVREQVSIPGALLSVDLVDDQGAVLITDSERLNTTDWQTTRSIQAVAYDGALAYQLDTMTITSPTGAASVSDGKRIFLAIEKPTLGIQSIGYTANTGRLATTGMLSLDTLPSSLARVDNYLLAGGTGWLEMADVSGNGKLTAIGNYSISTNVWLQLERTAIVPNDALFIPAGAYGVEMVPLR